MFTVKELRQSHDITGRQMASKLGIAVSTYCDKEAGRRKFKSNEIVQICTMFDVRVEHVKDFYSRKSSSSI